MAPARQFRYVTYKSNSRGKPGWVVQVSSGGQQVTLGGIHATQLQAAKVAAAHLKTTVQDLRLSKAQKPPSSRRRPAVQRRLKQCVYTRGSKFVVLKDNCYQGTFDCLADAEAAAAELQPEGAPPQLKARAVQPGQLLERIALGMRVYKGYEPPDLENLTAEFSVCRGLWAIEPALAFFSCLGKYGPWREALRRQALAAKLQQGAPLLARTAALLRVLQLAVQDMQGVDEHLWRQNCGRGVHHHCSWLPVLQRFKLLVKWSRGPEKKLMLSGADDDAGPATAYAWQGKSKEAQANLQQFILACDLVWPFILRPMTTCQQYMTRVQEITAELETSGLDPPAFSTGYGGPKFCCSQNSHNDDMNRVNNNILFTRKIIV